MSSAEEGEDEVYCICRSSDVTRFMIGCDHCEEWYHGDCVNVNERDAKYIKKYYCKICTGKNSKLQIVYKSKYKDKEVAGTTSSNHYKQKDKDSNRSSHDKHREKYASELANSKSKSTDKEKYRDKEREKVKEKDRKHREEYVTKDHSSKHGHDKDHRKQQERNKDREDKEKRRKDKEKHRNDKHHGERKKEKQSVKESDIVNDSKKLGGPGHNENNSYKRESIKEVSRFVIPKKDNSRGSKAENPESLLTGQGTTKADRKDFDNSHVQELKPEAQGAVQTFNKSDTLSQMVESKHNKIDLPNNVTSDRVLLKDESPDKEIIQSPISTAPKHSAHRKSVLKELKNIPETDESAALDIAIKSDDDSGEDSDDRWTERPPKSSKKSKFMKQTKKRAKSPNKGASSTSKKRRFMDSAKSRRTMRGTNYYKGDSSDDGNYTPFGVTNDVSELRQCFGHKCVKPARPQSNYCSDKCGINLASHRIVQTLPDRLRGWNLTQCVADNRNRKDLEKIRADIDAVKSRLEELNDEFRNLEILIERGKLQPIVPEKEDEEDGGDTEKPSESEMTVHCVTCGQDLHTRTAIRHMERCYNKYESQASFASKFKTQIKNHRMFCDFYNPKEETYCKRLQVLCPEHNPDPKVFDDEVCGYPIQKEIFAKPSEFCRLSKKNCQPHVFWEKLRRAEIDMERVRQWMKVDELIEQERAVKATMSNRAGVLGLLLHSTFNHELDDRFKAAQQAAEAQRAQMAAQAKAKQAAQAMVVNEAKLALEQQAEIKISGNSATLNVNMNA